MQAIRRATLAARRVRTPSVLCRSFHHQRSPLAMARILCSDPINAICPEILRDAGHDVTCASATLTQEELVQQIENYDALIVRSGSTIDREVLHAASQLQLIGRAGTGVDNIDVVTATKQGILVMNTPFGNTMSAAELTLGLLTSLSQSSTTNTTRRSEIHDKTIGIIGLGRIGREVASRCNAFGMNVIGYDPIVSDNMAKSHAIEPVSLNELFARSDYISLHIPLNPNTNQLVNASRLALCKDGVKLINTARAGLMDVEAVLEALEQGKLAKVAFDIIPPSSPSPTWQKLVTHPHVIVTPHIGASTLEAQSRVAHDIAVSVDAALQGTGFQNVLNAPNIDLERRQEQLPFLSLGEKVGSMQAQLLSSESRIERITIISEGRKLTSDTTVSSLLVNSVLKGLFSHFLEEPVTLETARSLAEGMGIHCVEQKHEEVLTSSSYASLLTVKVDVVGQTSSSMTIAGTVFGKSQLRLVALNGLSMDAIPNGSMLFFNNTDAPGVLHTVTSVLAQHSINIGCFGLARDALGGQAVGVLNVDEPIPDHVMSELHELDTVTNLRQVTLLELDTKRWITPWSSPSMLEERTSTDVEIVTDKKPGIRPQSPNFGSGPCKKRPGYSLSRLSEQCLGRSHRSKLGKGLLEEAIVRSKALLGLPAGYELGIVPASDTGAFEMAMWNFLSNERPIDVCYWESFGKQWFTDITKELELTNVQEYTAPFGSLPDLTQTNPHHDVVFTWNGTTSGVCVPNGNWISDERTGLVFNDATSAAFAMDIPWEKIDVCTFSWQKVLGGEGGHGILILSPRAIERLEQNGPPKHRPMPKIFRLTDSKSGQLLSGIFEGSTINTPSMLCVEDYLDALRWAEKMGGVPGLIALSKRNLAAVEEFVEKNGRWIQFLAQTPASRSNTSVCLQFPELNKDQVKEFQKLLETENVAYDIGSYRDAPPGIRIWCGATVETKDLEALMPWIKWAYYQVKEKESKE